MVNLFLNISSISLIISDLTRNGEQLINNGLNNPTPLTLLIVFMGGFLTSLGPCSLSLLPITVAYLAGFNNGQNPFQRSLIFCSGIVLSLVILGCLSGYLGKIYGQLPSQFNLLVSIIAIVMGLNLLGILQLQFPEGPDLNLWENKIPKPLAPIAAGFTFGLASSPCTTPVLAVLLTWIAQSGTPLSGIILLAAFGSGQITPLLLAGTAAGTIPNILAIRSFSRWIPILSGVIFVATGSLTLLANWF